MIAENEFVRIQWNLKACCQVSTRQDLFGGSALVREHQSLYNCEALRPLDRALAFPLV